jgi:hypothetical protein
MKIAIEEIFPNRLTEYNRIPQSVEIKSKLQVELINQGLGGMLLREVPVDVPYLKDYDASGELPSDTAKKFDVRNWGFFLAMAGVSPVGAAMVACDTLACSCSKPGGSWRCYGISASARNTGASGFRSSGTRLNGREGTAVHR